VRPSPMQLMNHREFPVLYVDDEPQNLRIFEITFRRDFTVLTATSAAEGMRLLNENPIAVVLSDHKMPEMTGTEFLARVREIDPQTIRILVTAYGDAETLGAAINDGSIYRYVPKPWEPDEMRITLRRAIEAYALDRERDALIHELTMVNQLSRTLHREIDLDRLLPVLLDSAHHELGFDAAALLFFDDSQRELRWGGIEPDCDDVADAVRALEINVGTAPNFCERLQNGEVQALRVESLSELEAPIRQWVAEVSAGEILVVPLVGVDRVIGAMAIDNRSGGRRFGADDRTLLEGLAIQAVIAIQNARLVEDLKNSRQQVERADRLGTVGTLAAGLAHEINNPLTSIRTFLTLAPGKRESDDPEFWRDYHKLACSEVERIGELVSTMSRLARGGEEAPTAELVNVGEIATEVATLLQPQLNAAGVDLELEIDSEAPKLAAIRNQLHQVVLNLVVNALHASPRTGTIRVSIGQSEAGAPGGVRLVIADQGAGIPEEDLERIFNPFFTTKDPDQGTGLGLMISHQIVADHGGSIEVRSRVGEGAVFQVDLPARELGPASAS
jgi:two-component system NtrC family sensor kinase